jgi:hypothetical protein
VPILGLLYADDLVLICLPGELLRERLRRLASYAAANDLTVNVAKCEIVVFGKQSGHGKFRFNSEIIPTRTSCKYLRVWLDADRSGRKLKNAIFEKFRAVTPVFFDLCRRMRISDLDSIFRLARALLFSLLYGAEFLFSLDISKRCEATWWRGVRMFFGLPNGVSNVSLSLLFPQFSLVHQVLLAKLSLSLKALRPLPTLFPEAAIFDRGVLLERHRVGFSQTV